MMSAFICPVCREPLERCESSLKCRNRHSFDISRYGDVWLLQSSKRGEDAHGDSREMVLARRTLLESGCYDAFANALADIADKLTGELGHIAYFDAGCGTGYYTERISHRLSRRAEVTTVGVDLSRDAVRMCAKRMKGSQFAVASVYSLPVANESFDLITNIFSPQAESEYFRILKKGGILLYAVPAPRHLFAMKKVLYDEPYENEEKDVSYTGFEHIGRYRVDSTARLDNPTLMSLFKMTPYYWRTSREGAVRLEATHLLDVEISFNIHAFRRS